MKSESKLLESTAVTGSPTDGLNGVLNTAESPDQNHTGSYNNWMNSQMEESLKHAPGRKLDGKACPNGRMNPDIRYKMSKLTELSALVRQWEDSMLRIHEESQQDLLSSRIFYSRARGYPVCVLSVLQYAPEAERAKLERKKNEDSQGLEVFKQPARDWRGISYMSYLEVDIE